MTMQSNSHITGSPERVPADFCRRTMGSGTAHAKVILAGEHAVLYGRPAIALPLTHLRMHVRVDLTGTEAPAADSEESEDTATYTHSAPVHALCASLGLEPEAVRISVDNNIPYARGLGSSAALALALVRAVSDLRQSHLTEAEQLDHVRKAEDRAHGRASGIDAAIASTSTGHLRWFDAGTVSRLTVHDTCTAALLVVDSGDPSSTATSVHAVAEQYRRHPKHTEHIFDCIGAVVHDCAVALASADTDRLGAALSENHRLLSQLDLTTPRIDELIAVAKDAGALGAKVSGGGRGGCIVALFDSISSAHTAGERIARIAATRHWVTTLRTPDALA